MMSGKEEQQQGQQQKDARKSLSAGIGMGQGWVVVAVVARVLHGGRAELLPRGPLDVAPLVVALLGLRRLQPTHHCRAANRTGGENSRAGEVAIIAGFRGERCQLLREGAR